MANDKTPTTADELIALAVDSNRDQLMGFAKALEDMLRLAIEQRRRWCWQYNDEELEANEAEDNEELAKLARGEG